MQGSLNSPEIEGVTAEQMALLGREWFDFLLDVMPEDELITFPKLKHMVMQQRLEGIRIGEMRAEQRGRQEGEAKLLTRQLQRRFGSLPDWIQERIAQADSQLLEAWILRFVDARSLEEIFSD